MTTIKHDYLSSVRPDVTKEVEDFYDRYPYPRPVKTLDEYRRHWQNNETRRADFHLFWPGRRYSEQHSILVAGCGTSQAAKHAMRWPDAKVLGIDFSGSSLQATEDLKRRYNLANLELRQLYVERAAELGTSFDQIICTGVLHHLADPDAGLSALRSVLAPGGAMHLMVYAPYGRAGIYMLQEFCRRLGITASGDAIRDLATALKALPPGHPLEAILHEAPDFGHEAELADALLHPQDRAYTVPQFFDFLARAELTFGRWTRQAPYSPRCGVIAGLPQTPRIEQLPSQEQYAAAELFRGTMVRHSAIVYRDQDSAKRQCIDFAGDNWTHYVPIRMADTISVVERIPPGAAAVLINRSHTFKDLYLPIDATQARLFDAIDGERSIGAIMECAGSSSEIRSPDRARRFFAQLWWQDQVVFDASGL